MDILHRSRVAHDRSPRHSVDITCDAKTVYISALSYSFMPLPGLYALPALEKRYRSSPRPMDTSPTPAPEAHANPGKLAGFYYLIDQLVAFDSEISQARAEHSAWFQHSFCACTAIVRLWSSREAAPAGRVQLQFHGPPTRSFDASNACPTAASPCAVVFARE